MRKRLRFPRPPLTDRAFEMDRVHGILMKEPREPGGGCTQIRGGAIIDEPTPGVRDY